MQLIFFKAKCGNIWDKTISWFTKSEYSHVEIRFSDGMCFSSASLEYGVRFRYIDVNDCWDIIELPNVSEEKEEMVKNWCMDQIGRNYDWFGIFGYIYGYVFGWSHGCKNCLSDENCWYCSEICAYPLIAYGILNLPTNLITPGELYSFIKENA